MSACDQGYICDVCGDEVENITDSDLYLRYVMGEISPLQLPNMNERHIRCNPPTAQYITDSEFSPIFCEGIFAKENLDPDYVKGQEEIVTRAWRRLQEIPAMGIGIPDYPLAEVKEEWRKSMG